MIPSAVLITAIILLIGFFLPHYVLGFRDRQTVGRLDVIEGSISYEAQSDLGIIDRLKMITSAASIPLDNGKKLDADTAYQRALTEIDKFNSKAIIDFNFSACKLIRDSVSFYIDAADPTKNMIVWNLTIQDEGHTISVTVDDETGILLNLNYSRDIPVVKTRSDMISLPSGTPLADPAVMADSIADYYDLIATQPELEKNVKYIGLIFELSDGKESMTMTAGLTINGFWINI